jgi:hypothetical protein
MDRRTMRVYLRGRPRFHRGLGASTTATISTSLATAAAVDPEPISKGVLAIVAGLSSLFHIGQGCGQACVIGSQAEQVYEAAADNILAVAKAGMLTSDQAVQAMQWIQQQGDAAMSQLAQTDSKAKAGLENMDKVIAAEIVDAQTLPNTQTTPLDPSKMQALFLSPGTKGWYSDSLASAQTIAAEAISQLPPLAATTASASPEDLEALSSGALATVSAHPVISLAVAGALAWALLG